MHIVMLISKNITIVSCKVYSVGSESIHVHACKKLFNIAYAHVRLLCYNQLTNQLAIHLREDRPQLQLFLLQKSPYKAQTYSQLATVPYIIMQCPCSGCHQPKPPTINLTHLQLMFVCKHESIANLLFICNSRLLPQVTNSPLVCLHHKAINKLQLQHNYSYIASQLQLAIH